MPVVRDVRVPPAERKLPAPPLRLFIFGHPPRAQREDSETVRLRREDRAAAPLHWSHDARVAAIYGCGRGLSGVEVRMQSGEPAAAYAREHFLLTPAAEAVDRNGLRRPEFRLGARR